MSWYQINVIYDRVHLNYNVELRILFDNLWLELKCPQGFNLFELKEHPKGGEILFIPSPDNNEKISRFLQAVSAVPCNKPDGSLVTPVIGGTKDWELWFGNASGAAVG